MALERIQKVLSSAGYGSRRDCEQMVLEGRVSINGKTETEMPLLVDPESDRIRVDGRPLRQAKPVYLILNKPAGVYSTMARGEGRKTVGDLLARLREPVEPVGRTDAECAGLILLTNDRDLAAQLADMRRGVEKTYRVELAQSVSPELFGKLREGIRLSEGRTTPMRAKTIHTDRQRTILEIVANDHLQREIPRVLAKFGLKAKRLTRIKFGKISLRELPITAARMLTPEEVNYLKKAAVGIVDSQMDFEAGRRRSSTTRRDGRPRTDAAAEGIRDSRKPSTPALRNKGRGATPPRSSRPGKAASSPARTGIPEKRRRIILPDE